MAAVFIFKDLKMAISKATKAKSKPVQVTRGVARKATLKRSAVKKAPAAAKKTANRLKAVKEGIKMGKIKPIKLPKITRTSANKTNTEDMKMGQNEVLETASQFISLLRDLIENGRDKKGNFLYARKDKSKIACFAEEHDFDYQFIIGLLNGTRWLPRSDKSMVAKFAKVLNVSTLQVYNYCGFFDAKDVVATVSTDMVIKIAFDRLIKDPLMGLIAPNHKEWSKWPQSAQLRFILLYEVAAQKMILQHATMEFSDSAIKKIANATQK
jgi:hypothetical protein